MQIVAKTASRLKKDMLITVSGWISLEMPVQARRVTADRLNGIGTDKEDYTTVTFVLLLLVSFLVFAVEFLLILTHTPALLSISGGHCVKQKRP